jgi:lipopolysaccharide/colanic/teichoic acid biosynthesis glycosyltransferase
MSTLLLQALSPPGQVRAGRPYRIAKRCLDVAVCTALAPVTAVLGLICAAAIRLDSPGPVLLRQLRTGRNGNRFLMWKFRTMVVNAEELKEQLAHLNVLPPPDFKIPDDPRITRVGRFLRATSLDELPQLWNVVRGEMTLVGPRPTTFEPGRYALWHTRRLEATPGITGLWQVRGRNITTFDERLRLDIDYLDNQSLFLDLHILWETVVAIFARSGV